MFVDHRSVWEEFAVFKGTSSSFEGLGVLTAWAWMKTDVRKVAAMSFTLEQMR